MSQSARLKTIVTDYRTAISKSAEASAVERLIAYAEGLESCLEDAEASVDVLLEDLAMLHG